MLRCPLCYQVVEWHHATWIQREIFLGLLFLISEVLNCIFSWIFIESHCMMFGCVIFLTSQENILLSLHFNFIPDIFPEYFRKKNFFLRIPLSPCTRGCKAKRRGKNESLWPLRIFDSSVCVFGKGVMERERERLVSYSSRLPKHQRPS